MSEAVLLGIDLGAGSLKSTAIASDGRVLGAASRSIDTLVPRAGHSEQDPETWWAAVS